MIDKFDISKHLTDKLGKEYDFDEQLRKISKEYRDENRGIIFSHTSNMLLQSNSETHQIPLDLLSKFSEKSSYEDDPDIQKIWSNLLFAIATDRKVKSFYKKCIDTIDYISGAEIEVLEELVKYSKYQYYKWGSKEDTTEHINEEHMIGICEDETVIRSIKSLKYFSETDSFYIINNLVSLGVIENSSYELDADTDVSDFGEISVDLKGPDGVKLTVFGAKFWNTVRFAI